MDIKELEKMFDEDKLEIIKKFKDEDVYFIGLLKQEYILAILKYLQLENDYLKLKK